MAESLLSVGLDVGTTTTQLLVSELTINNVNSSFSVPDMQITQRHILHKSKVYFTPLQNDLVDGDQIRAIVEREYQQAGITRQQVDTGALIITGETSRKENAGIIASSLSEFAGDFVVATAGPHLESVLAAKGAGADKHSRESGKTVLHMDIGGGTSNLALIKKGEIIATGCMNIGGRLLKMDSSGKIYYRSPVLSDRKEFEVGQMPSEMQLQKLCQNMVQALQMACGLLPPNELLHRFWTKEAGNPWLPPTDVDILSFSGGVAACIERDIPPLMYGDIGPMLGSAIKNSPLCHGSYHLDGDAIRATVIGAGSHATQLSGSTVYYQNIQFPLKNLPVAHTFAALAQLDSPGILTIKGDDCTDYEGLKRLAENILAQWPSQPVYVAVNTDIAKALGHALALRSAMEMPILCIDRFNLAQGDYLDVGHPVGSALPVVIKTLILEG